jgi:hypothetical protein
MKLFRRFDLTRPSEELRLRMLYNKNQYYVSTPPAAETATVVDLSPDTDSDPNVFVPVSLLQGYSPQFNINNDAVYLRLSLDALQTVPGVVLALPAYPFQTNDILAQLGATLGVKFAVDDLVNETYLSEDNGLSITASATSVIWLGSKVLSTGPNTIDLTLYREEENGFLRLMEDNSYRMMEPAIA